MIVLVSSRRVLSSVTILRQWSSCVCTVCHVSLTSDNALLKVRLPKDISDEVDEDPTGNKALWDRGLLNGASQKVS